MSRSITFSLYNHKKDNKTQLITKAWEEWIPILTTHKTRGSPEDTDSEDALNEAKDGPAVILGVVKGKRSSNNVQHIHAFGLDIDNSTYEQIDNILQKLSPFEHVVYTTHKHGSNIASHPRIRVVLPVAEPLDPQTYPEAWEALQKLVDGAIDPSTKDCSRLHFLPSTFNPTAASSHHNKGRWITHEDLPTLQISTPMNSLDPEQADLHAQIVKSLKHLPKESDLKTAIDALLSNTAFAEPSNRHNTIRSITFHLARKFPTASRQTLEKLFLPSLTTMRSTQSDVPTFESVWTAFEGAKIKIKESLGDSSYSYPSQTLENIAKIQNCLPSQLEERWLIQKGGGGWVLDQDGNYRGFFEYRDFSGALRKYLSNAPVELLELNAQNRYVRKKTEDLLASNGSLAEKLISDMSKQYTVFEPKTCTMREAVTPLRHLIARFDPQIDTWLKLLFGANYEKGLDWMSVCPDLTKQVCAIYFSGTKDSGKTLFALGMAKLWTEGAPADIMLVMGDFNEELIRCPLILADEELPKNYQKQSVTTKLRSMLSTTTRSLHRKYMPPAELEGAIRLVLTANNDFLLSTDELHTAEDLAAIAQRFMYVQVSDEAAGYLATLDREVTAEWLEHGIAEHALWLQQNRVIEKPGNRFAVEGDIAEMHRRLLVGNPWSSLICEWIVSYLMEPQAFDLAHGGLVIRDKGKLYVCTQALVSDWKRLNDPRQRPDPKKIGNALNTIAVDNSEKRILYDGKTRRYKEIDMYHIYYWMKAYSIGEEDKVRGNLVKAMPPPAKQKEEPRSDKGFYNEEVN